MADEDRAAETLKRIQELWLEHGRTKANTPEFHTITERIRVLSAECMKLVKKSGE